jgi:DNA-binding transcriptional LysR family regulator
MLQLGRIAPRLHCELVEAEPEQALPALAVGDVDVVLGDEWRHQPWRLPPSLTRHDLFPDPVRIVLPTGHPLARKHREAVPLQALADETWVTGQDTMGWDEMIRRTCRALGGFEPRIGHRITDVTVSLALVKRGLAVTLLPELALIGRPSGLVVRRIDGAEVDRTIAVVTRHTDAARPSTQAVLAAVQEAASTSP